MRHNFIILLSIFCAVPACAILEQGIATIYDPVHISWQELTMQSSKKRSLPVNVSRASKVYRPLAFVAGGAAMALAAGYAIVHYAEHGINNAMRNVGAACQQVIKRERGPSVNSIDIKGLNSKVWVIDKLVI